jgi:pSer/pThr/pTyr-binding forkhead associated (FHA) protein
MHFSLVMKLNDGTERKFPLRQSRTVIGRETRCHVRIALPNIAERHCEIVLDDGELKLSDLGSDLGTLVNGSPIRKTVLNPADELTVGPVTFHVRREMPAAPIASVESATVDGKAPLDEDYDSRDGRRVAATEIEVNLRDADPLAGERQSPATSSKSAAPRRTRK